MVCGVEPSLSGCKFAVAEKVTVKEGEGEGLVSGGGEKDASRVVKRVVTYTIDTKQFKPRSVDALLMFPFNPEDKSDASGFTVDGQFSLFLSSEQMGLRLVDQRLKDTDVLRIKSKSLSSSGFDNGVVRITMSPKAVTKPTNIDQQEGAIQKVMLPLQSALGTILSQMQGTPLLTVTYQWEQTRDMGSEGGMSGMGDWKPAFDGIKDDASKITATSGFKVLKANGSEDGDFSAGNLGALVAGAGKKVRLNAAVWLRVLNNNSQVVDMVPACLADDEDQRAGNLQVLKPLAAPISGDRTPLMKFETGVSFDFSIAGLQGLSAGIDMQAAPKAALVNDPRFNHAPENWFKYESSLSENGYLTELNNSLPLGANGRDGDIFMATSDSGYMQSAYELAFIPRFTNLKNYGSSQVSGDLTSLSGLDWKEFPDNAGSTRQAGFAWRTYAPYGDDAEAFEDLGISSDGTGQKVNPYSDSVNVLMSVFANTPIDWKRSSTNQVSGAPDYATMSAREFNSLYAFNGYGQNCRIEWDDLKAVAEAYTNCVGELFRNGRDDGATWEDAFNNLGWDYVEDELCGVRLSQNDAKHRLWSVDRKFLYGFWHDCMTPRQQLYIVFVRAEPMMMGGSGTGGVPPQLGSRAVAVVWRDPTPATQPEYPHRTRVLFYRQFE